MTHQYCCGLCHFDDASEERFLVIPEDQWSGDYLTEIAVANHKKENRELPEGSVMLCAITEHEKGKVSPWRIPIVPEEDREDLCERMMWTAYGQWAAMKYPGKEPSPDNMINVFRIQPRTYVASKDNGGIARTKEDGYW